MPGGLPRRHLRLVCLTLLVATAGCTAVLGPESATEQSPATPTATPAATVTAQSPTPTAAPTATVTATATATPRQVDPDNPFGERTVAVAVATDVDEDRRAVVRRALAYWEANASTYAGYPVSFELVEPSAPHRIELTFEPPPVTCGSYSTERTIGCAPVNRRDAPAVSAVTVAANQSPAYTHEILVHELGHVLGLDHDDEPHYYMQGTLPSGLTRDTVQVYLTGDDTTETGRQRSELVDAFDYFETHQSLAPDERPTFEFVTTVEQADFVVEIGDGGCFDDSAGSCGGEAPYRGQEKLVLDSLDTEVVAWHTGYHLARVYFEEVPPSLESDTPRAERTYWDG